jgi:hypothetical protein
MKTIHDMHLKNLYLMLPFFRKMLCLEILVAIVCLSRSKEISFGFSEHRNRENERNLLR